MIRIFPRAIYRRQSKIFNIVELVFRGCWRGKGYGLSADDQEYHPVDDKKLSTLLRSCQHSHLIYNPFTQLDWSLFEETWSRPEIPWWTDPHVNAQVLQARLRMLGQGSAVG